MYVQHNEQNNTADLYMTSKINIPEYDKESAIHQTLYILKQQSELVKVTIVNDFLKRRPKKHYEQFILSAVLFTAFAIIILTELSGMLQIIHLEKSITPIGGRT